MVLKRFDRAPGERRTLAAAWARRRQLVAVTAMGLLAFTAVTAGAATPSAERGNSSTVQQETDAVAAAHTTQRYVAHSASARWS